MFKEHEKSNPPATADTHQGSRYFPVGMVAIALVFSMGLCWFTFTLLRKQISEECRGQFTEKAVACFDEIEALFKRYEIDLYSLKTFFECSETVTPQEFQDFTRLIIQSHPGLQAICWIPNISPDQRQAHEETARLQGFDQYRLTPSLSRNAITAIPDCSVYYPIYYVEPLEENEMLRGRNLSSVPEWLAVLQKTAQSGLPAARIDPILFTDQKDLCIMLFYPVYANEAASSKPGDKQLRGFAAAVVFPQRDLNALINGSTDELKLRVSYFQKDVQNRSLLSQSQVQPASALQYLRHEIPLADQTLLTEAMLVKHYYPLVFRLLPFIVLVSGMLLSSLLVLHIYNVQRQNKRIEQTVIGRTQDLLAEQEKCRMLAQKAQLANRAKSEFLAGMSHEIRTPMNAIIGFAEILADENMAPMHREYIKTIHESGQTLMTLINDILDLSKIEAGRMLIEWMDCSLRELLNHIDVLLRPQAERKDIDFAIQISEELPAIMRLDPTRMRQCLMNLVSNAIKFTECGHICVQASLENQQGCEWLRIDVEDTGIGIDSEHQQTIFNAFAQADVATSRLFGGTGLGLSITKQLAELMKGSLSVTSTPSKGSVFTLMLPLEPSEHPALVQT